MLWIYSTGIHCEWFQLRQVPLGLAIIQNNICPLEIGYATNNSIPQWDIALIPLFSAVYPWKTGLETCTIFHKNKARGYSCYFLFGGLHLVFLVHVWYHPNLSLRVTSISIGRKQISVTDVVYASLLKIILYLDS